MKSLSITTAAFAVLSSFASAAPVVDQLVGYGAGTTGGGSATAKTVTSCSDLKAAVSGTAAKVVRINGMLSGCGVLDVGSNTSIFGVGSNSGATGSGFRVKKGSNVIFRNLKLGPAPSKSDILSFDQATQIWVDHCELKSVGLTGGKDDYDGLLDATHASDLITVSWTKFHDHWKGSLVGHSDDNASEDTGHLRITYHHNQWISVNSRLPSLRFGTGHVFNSHFKSCPTSGVHSRMGAKVLAESNQFDDVPRALVTNLDSDVDGYMCDKNNVLTGTSTKSITQTSCFTPPYSYTVDSASTVASTVAQYAGVGVVSP